MGIGTGMGMGMHMGTEKTRVSDCVENCSKVLMAWHGVRALLEHHRAAS